MPKEGQDYIILFFFERSLALHWRAIPGTIQGTAHNSLCLSPGAGSTVKDKVAGMPPTMLRGAGWDQHQTLRSSTPPWVANPRTGQRAALHLDRPT